MKKTMPTFLGIGAHKAGTSWLYKQLTNHPEIWMPPVKELHFFDRSLRYPGSNDLVTSSPLDRALGSKHWERPRVRTGLRNIAKCLMAGEFRNTVWWSKWTFGKYNEDWYSGLFSQAVSYKACGDITPSYSILEKDDVVRIKAVNPDIKIIFMIRNPIERAWSAVRFNVDRGFSKISLDSDDEVITELKAPGYVLRGDYEHTLDTYLRYFDSRQILVCFYDAIKCDPIGLMSGITTFLDVSSFKESTIDNKTRVNVSPTRKMQGKVKEYLIETYTPMTNRIAERFGSYATRWDGIESPYYMKSGQAYPPIQLPPVLHPW